MKELSLGIKIWMVTQRFSSAGGVPWKGVGKEELVGGPKVAFINWCQNQIWSISSAPSSSSFSTALICEPLHVSESLGCLLKMDFYAPPLEFLIQKVRPKNLHFWQIPGWCWCCLSGDHSENHIFKKTGCLLYVLPCISSPLPFWTWQKKLLSHCPVPGNMLVFRTEPDPE